MRCSRCQHDNPRASRFCNQCGMPVPGSPDKAGSEPTGAAVLTSLAALEGERKLVTVLFADLRGSLELVADRDPEDARQLLDPVLEQLMAAVHRYEGTVNQVMGDGIMALFGAPVAHEDHALRACRSALLMQAAMLDHAREVETRLGVAPRLRVGLHSGEVVVRAVGSDLRLDYTAVGETTHLAARMEQMAEPGTVLITGATARLVEDQFTLRPRGPTAVKGVRTPVDVWELLGPGPGHSRLEVAARRGLTALIGRASELAALHQALDEVGAGRSQVVALVGEPGVGKSRLVWAFLAGARHRGWRVVEADGRPHLRGLAYSPVVAVLRGLLDLIDDAAGTTVTMRLREALGPEAATRFLPPLAALLDTPVDDVAWAALVPAERRQRTLDALRYLLARPSAGEPLCLVMEDLHWIDSETQAVLDDLVGDLPPAPVLLLVTYRPEYEHGWAGKAGYAQVRVEPLSRPHADALAAALLGAEGTDDLRSLLVERTEGNPLFMEETVRHLTEARILAGGPGAYRLNAPVRSIEIPATVQAMLAARIDRLAPDDKRLLQVAAAIGKDFEAPLLEAIADLPPGRIGPALGRLRARGLVYETRLAPAVEHTFKHALTHEVAYGSLVRERRRALDHRIVEVLEARAAAGAAPEIDRLARHAIRGELWDKALTYCREAGERAFARSAHRAAAVYFEQALDVLARLPATPPAREQAIDLRLALRNALSSLGDHRRILTTLTEAERLAAELGDRRRLSLVSANLANYFTLRADFPQATAQGQRALALAEELGDVALAIPANAFLSLALWGTGDYRAAAALAERNVQLLVGEQALQRLGMTRFPAVYSRTILAWSLVELGEFERARAASQAAVQLAESLDHPDTTIFAALGLGLAHLRQGAFPEAIAVLEHAQSVGQEAELPAFFLELAYFLAPAYARGGRPDEAIALLDRAVQLAITLRHRLGHWLGSGCLAEAYLAAGRAEDALPRARVYLELARAVGARGSEAYALHLLGEVMASLDSSSAAEADGLLEQAVTLAGALGMRPLVARCHLDRGLLAQRAGDVERGRGVLEIAIRSLRELEMTRWEVQATRALAGHLPEPGGARRLRLPLAN